MQQEPVNILTDLAHGPSIYGSFKQRALASVIDLLVQIPLLLLDWFNRIGWKSPLLLTISFLLGLVYKPFVEFM